MKSLLVLGYKNFISLIKSLLMLKNFYSINEFTFSAEKLLFHKLNHF